MTADEFSGFLTRQQKDFILEVVFGGLADYASSENYSSSAKLDHGPAVRAAIRNSHIVARAGRAIMAQPDLGIRFEFRRGQPLFIVNDQVRIKFKKFDRALLSRNYPTRQAIAFLDQRFPDFEAPEVENMVVGYRANSAETDFEVFVTKPSGPRVNEWHLKLSGGEMLELIAAFPATPLAPTSGAASRVKVRGTAASSDATGTE